jgi:hypothetical protein
MLAAYQQMRNEGRLTPTFGTMIGLAAPLAIPAAKLSCACYHFWMTYGSASTSH